MYTYTHTHTLVQHLPACPGKNNSAPQKKQFSPPEKNSKPDVHRKTKA